MYFRTLTLGARILSASFPRCHVRSPDSRVLFVPVPRSGTPWVVPQCGMKPTEAQDHRITRRRAAIVIVNPVRGGQAVGTYGYSRSPAGHSDEQLDAELIAHPAQRRQQICAGVGSLEC